jgi:hypothetical protein
MPAPHSFQYTPAAADLPSGVDLQTILVDVANDHVFAPAEVESQLVAVVDHARTEGVDLNIVDLGDDSDQESQLRDLATAVGHHTHGTVLVLGRNWAGTYSDSFSRVRLEGAEDVAKFKKGDAVFSAQVFVDKLAKPPTVSWTGVSCVVVGLSALVVAGLWWVKARRAKGRRMAPATVVTVS